MGKPLSWKWKIAIGAILFVLIGTAFILTPGGQAKLIGNIDEQLETMPESEKRDSDLADRYLFLCWWRANIMLDGREAMKMYKDFLGYNADAKGNTFLTNGKLNSKYVSPDGKTGWGPMHPRAPEAFFSYLELYQSGTSSQMHVIECYNYYMLFYVWMQRYSPDHKPHPAFKKYWPKIKNWIAIKPGNRPPEVDMAAPLAPEWVETKSE